jgi:type IV pilus assembly protein PilO
MSEFMDRFFELEARERLLLSAGLVVLVLGLYFYFVYSGRRAELTSTRATNEDLRTQRDTKKKLVANLEAQRTLVRELQAKVRLAEARLPDQKEIPNLLSNVSSAGRESGLEILLFRQKVENYKDFYAEVPVEVLVRGTYQQVATFFDRVGQLDRIVNVSDISMKAPNQEGDSMIIDTSCSAVTFRFLDEEERARVAKEKAEAAKKKKSGGGA